MSDKPLPEFGGRTWGELEVSRHENGRLMFADVLRMRNPAGIVEERKIRVCVPQPSDQIEARVAARALFAKKKLDAERDKDLFAEVEQLCLLARAIRTHEEPHAQKYDVEELAELDESSIHDVQERINAYKAMLDPREADITEDRFWRKVAELGRAGNMLPLTDIAGRAQPSFVLRMAREALLSPTGKSFARLFGISTPEHSTSQD